MDQPAETTDDETDVAAFHFRFLSPEQVKRDARGTWFPCPTSWLSIVMARSESGSTSPRSRR